MKKAVEEKPQSNRGGFRANAGRPRGTVKYDVYRIRLGVDVDVNAVAKLDAIARKYKVSKSDALAIIISTYEVTSFPAHAVQYQDGKAKKAIEEVKQ